MQNTILIVDDERGIRDTLRGVLEDEGFAVETAESGEACLDLIKKRDFNCILLDIWLGDGIDGLETLANGHTVVKVRVRAIADGGEANRAVIELLAKALGVPKAKVRILSGTTSRHKQVAVDGDPARLGEILRKLTTTKPD